MPTDQTFCYNELASVGAFNSPAIPVSVAIRVNTLLAPYAAAFSLGSVSLLSSVSIVSVSLLKTQHTHKQLVFICTIL